MSRNVVLAIFVLLAASLASRASATLIGDTVQGSMLSIGIEPQTNEFAQNSAIVTHPGPAEFTFDGFRNTGIRADFLEGDKLKLTFLPPSSGSVAWGARQFDFWDLDFGHPDLHISGLSLLSDTIGVDFISFADHSIRIVTSQTDYVRNTLSATFQIETAMAPEPATLALMGLGLGAAGLARRRRARRA